MEEKQQPAPRTHRGRKILLGIFLAFAGLVVLLFVALKIYLASPYPAAELSRILSASLGTPVVVAGIESSGATIYLKGVRVPNPPAFPAGNLLYADSLAIAPEWRSLFTQKRSFRLIDLNGIRVDALQNSRGDWNFSPIQRRLASQKPSATETAVRHLTLEKGALSINGQVLQDISLELFNFSSKGARDSSVALYFEDPWRNRYDVKGRTRPGPTPAVDVTVNADTVSLASIISSLPPSTRKSVRGGVGKLAVHAALADGVVSCDGRLDFRDLRVFAGGTEIPLAGRLTVAGDYSQKKDEATVRNAVLALEHLGTIRGTGSASDLRHQRRFRAELALDEADLSRLPFLLPQRERARTSVGGKIGCRTVRLAGSATAGLTEASGAVLLRDATLKRDGRTVFSGLGATVELQRADGRIVTTGRAAARAAAGSALVEKLEAQFDATLSPKLKPLAARVSLPVLRFEETDLTGRVAYDASFLAPYTVSADLPSATLVSFNRFLEPYAVKFTGGSGTLSLSGTGRSAADFSATVRCRIAGATGVRGDKAFSLGTGATDSAFRKKGKDVAAAGKIQLSALDVAGKKGDADFSYKLAGNVVTLENGSARFAGSDISFATLVAAVPRKEGNAYAVSVDVKGGGLRQGALELKGCTGSVRGRYVAEAAAAWLEGDASLAAQSLLWHGKSAGAPAARFSLTRGGGKGAVTGTLFGGGVDADVAFQPAVPDEWHFNVKGAGAQLKPLLDFAAPGKVPAVADGTVDVRADGSYSRRAGINCRFQVTGKGIALKGGGGKSVLSGGGVALAGALAGEKLTVTSGELLPGPKASLRFQGEVDKVFSPQRVGRLTFSLPRTAVNDLIGPFMNLMPRLVQESNTDGALAADGTLALRDGKELLEGTIVLDDVRLDDPAQKLQVSGVKGKIPVSLDLAGKEAGKPGAGLSVSRENYPRLLQQLQQPGASASTVTIAKVAYGTLELGAVTMDLQAERGLTEIRSLRTSLYDGLILGKGTVSMKQGGTFRFDLLANGVSLKKLCNAVPNIKGYISGRIDGFLSVTGTGKGLKGLVGYTDLWARSGKGERMVVSKEFLQRLSNQKLSGFFFSSDRPYDKAEIRALLQDGDLTFQVLDIEHTNLFGVRDLSVSIVATQNRIALDHLLASIQQAATRGKAATGPAPTEAPQQAPSAAPPAAAPAEEFKWQD